MRQVHGNRRERGSALIFTVVVVMGITTLVAGVFLLGQSMSAQTRAQTDSVSAFRIAETAADIATAQVRGVLLERSGEEWLGFVGQEFDPGSLDTRTITGTLEGVDYTVRIRSAYFAHKNGTAPAGYLVAIPTADRNDVASSTFDLYEVTSVVDPVGASGRVRAVRKILEVTKSGGTALVPAPLYIDNDTDPTFAGNAFNVSGADHSMRPTGGGGGGAAPPCGTCGGDGLVDCSFCGGTGIKSGKDCKKCEGGTVTCDTCGGTGAAPLEGGESGHEGEEDYFIAGSPDYKPAVAYNGPHGDDSDFGELVFKGSGTDQIYTYDEAGTRLEGSDAFVSTKVDLRAMAASFVGGTAENIVPGPGVNDYGSIKSGGSLGTIDDFEVTYVGPGASETVAGKVEGGGVLVYDGDLQIAGQFTWYGLVIVLGDMKMTGGGADIHVFGSIMVESQSWVGGNADIWWSQEAIDKVNSECNAEIHIAVRTEAFRELSQEEIVNEGLIATSP